MDAANDNEKSHPSLGRKIVEGLTIAGAVGLLLWCVRSIARDFKKNPVETTMHALLDGGLETVEVGVLTAGGIIGGIYSYFHGRKERLEKKNHELEIENAVLKAQKQMPAASPQKSWAAAEQAKAEAGAEAQLTR